MPALTKATEAVRVTQAVRLEGIQQGFSVAAALPMTFKSC